MKLAFICTGNTCRSSMAEALARKWLEAHMADGYNIKLGSAGLAARPGSPASQQAVDVMASGGIDLRGHRARQVSSELVQECHLILAMTESHKRALVEMYPFAAGRIYTLSEFAGQPGFDISDPFGRSVEVYRQCAGEIAELLDKVLRKILEKTTN